MDKFLIAVLTIGFVVVVVGLMVVGWMSRRRRQSGLGRPAQAPADLGTTLLETPMLYVGSTYAADPLNRVTTGALGFRAKATLIVASSGVVLGIPGQQDTFIPRDALVGVGRGTWTIDRVVEQDGLLVISWLLGDSTLDSYARLTGSTPIDEVVSTIQGLVPGAQAIEASEEATGSESV
ncbi:hypothetical protein [Diaminobutyricimonas sp. LJ205]|uniref:PH-like domain-containing protein n=1 Tax=Diaminobutyricimonas sp. LJ205 TaxID=2683590 RepID=UPI0012F51195|nr:hypothetical protein [Diaminobutyricimonas sp. LJ205]